MTPRADIASGTVTQRDVDLRLPGYIPLELSRVYSSRHPAPGPFGYGWRFSLDVTLRLGYRQVLLRGLSGRDVVFDLKPAGGAARHEETGLVLDHQADAFFVQPSPRLRLVFPKRNALRDVVYLDRIEDLNGNQIRLAYNGPRLFRVTDTVGRSVLFTYSGDVISEIRVEAAAEPPALVRSFRYDRQGDLIATVDAARQETTYRYEDHLLVSTTSRPGGAWFVQYDDARRCVALWRGDGAEGCRLAYDDLRETTRTAGVDGLQTIYLRDGTARVLQQRDAFGDAEHYYYDGARRLVGFSAEGRAGVVFQVREQDPQGASVMRMGRGERLTLVAFDASGLPVRASDAFDDTYVLRYDGRKNLVGLTTPTGAGWTFGRDPLGAVTEVVSPEGRRVRLLRSSSGRELSVEDDLGPCYRERCDLFGRLVERTDALGRRQRRQYDALHRLTEVTVDAGYHVLFTYDDAGRLLSRADADGKRTTLEYDAAGKLVAYGDADGRRLRFEYDERGGFKSATNARGQPAHLAYDDRGRLHRITAFDGGTQTCRYEENGFAVTTEGAAGRSVRRYDAHLDLVSETLADGAERSFRYDPTGRLRTAETPDGLVVFDYDAEGRVVSVRAERAALTCAYDRDGNLTVLEDDAGGRITLSYDRRSRVAEVDAGRGVSRFSYDAADRLSALEGPSGEQLTFRYDVLDRLVERRLVLADGSEAGVHPFERSGGGPPLADPLPHPSPSAAAGAEGVRGLVLLQSGRGMALLAGPESLRVPVWGQHDALERGGTPRTLRIVRACIDGPEASLPDRRRSAGLDLLAPWADGSQAGPGWYHTDLPRSRDLGRPWWCLDRFFLGRTFDEGQFLREALQALSPSRAGLARPFGRLTARTVEETSAGRRLWEPPVLGERAERTFLLRKRGSLGPGDVLHLLIDQP